MFSVKSLSLALLMGGSAIAVPHHKRQDVVQVTDMVMHTAVVATVTSYVAPGSKPTSTPVVQVAVPAITPAASPAPSNPVSDAVNEVSSAASGATSGGTDDYMAIVNKYRGLMGLSTLTLSPELQDGIQQTVDNGDGQMVHAFHDDATGQVLAPATSFYNAFVQAWLCEIPSLIPMVTCNPELYNAGGDTGHADILKNPDLTEIGCAVSDGIWGCDTK